MEEVMIQNWNELVPGKFYRLRCHCAGLVTELLLEGDEINTGFKMVYAKWFCGDEQSTEQIYRDGIGPFVNVFRGNQKHHCMPAIEIDPPEWWKEIIENFSNDMWKEALAGLNAALPHKVSAGNAQP